MRASPRCLVVVTQKAFRGTNVEKKSRRDVQDVFAKLLEPVVSSASSGRSDRPPDYPSTPRSTGSSNDSARGTAQELRSYIAGSLVPSLKVILGDDERVLQSCSVIFQSIVLPHLRQRFKALPLDDGTVLDIALAICRMPGTSKLWRSSIGDIVNDDSFGQISAPARKSFRKLVSLWLDQERDRFPEMLSRLVGSSSNLFANRDSEMLQRAHALRKISLALLSAEMNHYVVQLPAIQEKLVDLLRGNLGSLVLSEVYLCWRVILCRISPQHLVPFWPNMLSDLLRIFDESTEGAMAGDASRLGMLLAACKVLDLMLCLQYEDLQIHSWMFVTDTVDAIYPPVGWSPEAITDCLAESLGPRLTATPDPDSETGTAAARRPRLANVKRINTIADLGSFLATASVVAYENVYQGLQVDWNFVDASLESEIFESV